MTMIPFDMTARDYYVAGCIRRGIREHRARLNERERQAHKNRTQVAPCPSPLSSDPLSSTRFSTPRRRVTAGLLELP